jgi:hypothetical protein
LNSDGTPIVEPEKVHNDKGLRDGRGRYSLHLIQMQDYFRSFFEKYELTVVHISVNP